MRRVNNMSIVKVAVEEESNKRNVIYIQNSPSSKVFNGQNVAAATVGGTTRFLANEAIQSKKIMPKYNDLKLSHRYGRRMGSVLAGFAGAAGTYALMNQKGKDSGDYLALDY